MHKVIEKIQQTRTVTGRSGKTHQLRSYHKRLEGLFLYNLVRVDPSVKKTLEIGCAQGLSSLHICAATEGREEAWHTIIDPFQNAHWDGVGIKNLASAGFDAFDLVEKKSEFVMPALAQRDAGQYDLILINGWHTFDHTLVDCFYATLLLRVGGYLILDSVTLESVRRVAHLLHKWPCYEEFASVKPPVPQSVSDSIARVILKLVQSTAWPEMLPARMRKNNSQKHTPKMIAFKKSEPDRRDSDWHDSSF
jgi:predicted O-methyltransferase YrrM